MSELFLFPKWKWSRTCNFILFCC